jgi:hypothetical protein
MSIEITEMTVAEWLAEGERRFGANPIDWRFVCPVCGNVASGHDFKAAGATDPDVMRCECIGRYTGGRTLGEKGPGPCDYAGYGLFRLSPVRVTTPDGKVVHSFAFGDPVDAAEGGGT